ncbi:hypothetical protein, partial [Streptomyces sp. NPDC058424]|uniref:hypothetical protein n=1 Tax=Streptomyces sp. NPDC058424 TaxID=3346491 RepID=UPI003668571C
RSLTMRHIPGVSQEPTSTQQDHLLHRGVNSLGGGTIRGDIGLDAKTAMRYADSARALLQQAAEQQLQ